MFDVLNRYSPVLMVLIVVVAFILNSALRIKDTRLKLDEEGLRGWTRIPLTYVLLAHIAIILGSIVVGLIFVLKIFVW